MKILAMTFLLLLTGCLQEGILTPQDPLWERESCARCRMVLSEKRFAVQRILSSGEVHYYDDVVCAMKHNHSHSDGRLYVRPYGGEDWVAAEEARFASGLRTPMNSGFGAVLEGGTVSFDEIKEHYKE